MPVATDEIDRRVETLASALRDRGFKLTRQRLEVVREVASTDEHPDVETIYRGVRTRISNISLDTVYRTLGTLVESGLVTRVAVTPGPARYDANIGEHGHFVCSSCGLVRDVQRSGAGASEVPVEATTVGVVESVEIQYRGVCSRCVH